MSDTVESIAIKFNALVSQRNTWQKQVAQAAKLQKQIDDANTQLTTWAAEMASLQGAGQVLAPPGSTVAATSPAPTRTVPAAFQRPVATQPASPAPTVTPATSPAAG